MKKISLTFMLVLAAVAANAADQFVKFKKSSDATFALATKGQVASIVCDANEDAGVLMALGSLQADLENVTGVAPALGQAANGRCIIAGSLGTDLIQKLLKSGKIRKADLDGKVEKYILKVVEKPLPGVDEALVIAGSDKRGTIYGIYELSRQAGVSPWYWWADVPAKHQDNIYIKKGVFTDGEPAVRYRGIFINDEWPSFGNWANEHFGDNPQSP